MKKLFIILSTFLFCAYGYTQTVDSTINIFNELRVNTWVKKSGVPAWRIDGYRAIIFNGDTLVRTNSGVLRAEEAKVYANGSNMSTALQSAFDYVAVKWISFGSDSARVYIFNSSVNAHGKTLKFENGNMLNGTGAIDSITVVASDYDQIFGSALTVTNLKGSNGYISPNWFGAKGNGTTDDTSPLQKTLSLTNIKVKTPVGSTYYVTDSLTLHWSNSIDMPDGSIILSNAAAGKHGIMAGDYDDSHQVQMREKTYSIRIQRYTQSDWGDTNTVGIKLVNINYSKVTHASSTKFTIGMKTIGYNTGLAYVDYYLGLFERNMVDIWIATLNPGGLAWNNQNNYYGGWFRNGSENTGQQTWGVWYGNGSYAVTNNNFFGQSLEKRSNAICFRVISGSRNLAYFFRSENNSDTTVKVEEFGTSNSNNDFYASRDGGTGDIVDLSYGGLNNYTSAERIAYEKSHYTTIAELDNIAEHCIYNPDSSVNIRYPGLFQVRSGGGAYPVNTLAGVRLVNDYVEITSSDNYGVSTDYIDASVLKRFVIKQLVDTGGVGVSTMITLYDRNGQLLGDTTVIQSGFTFTYSTTYGGGFYTHNPDAREISFRLPKQAQKFRVKFIRPETGLSKFKGYKIVSYQRGIAINYAMANNRESFNLSPSVPTLGSFRIGKVIYNSAPSDAAARGWICTASGTFDPGGTLTGVTGSITNATTRLILSSGGGAKVQKGQWLSLNSVASRIIGISGDTVYINRALTGGTISGGAIAFATPAFIDLSRTIIKGTTVSTAANITISDTTEFLFKLRTGTNNATLPSLSDPNNFRRTIGIKNLPGSSTLTVIGVFSGDSNSLPAGAVGYWRAYDTAWRYVGSNGGDGGGGGGSPTIDDNSITYAKIQAAAGLSVIGRSANSTGNVGAIVASTDGDWLYRNGSSLVFGQPDIPFSKVTGVPTMPLKNLGSGGFKIARLINDDTIGVKELYPGDGMISDSTDRRITFHRTSSSSTHTPTLSSTANISSNTPHPFLYYKDENNVFMDGIIEVTATATTTTSFSFDLPFSPDFTDSKDIRGTCLVVGSGSVVPVIASTSTEKAIVVFAGTASTSYQLQIHIAYSIVQP